MAAAAPTLEQLQQRAEYEKQRLAIGKQARDLKKLVDSLDEGFFAWLKASRAKAKTRFGYRLSIGTGKASPSWKGEFLKVAGPEGVAAVEAALPEKEFLDFEAPQ